MRCVDVVVVGRGTGTGLRQGNVGGGREGDDVIGKVQDGIPRHDHTTDSDTIHLIPFSVPSLLPPDLLHTSLYASFQPYSSGQSPL